MKVLKEISNVYKYLNVVIEYFIIIMFGVLVFYIDDRELSKTHQIKIIIVSICLLKTIYFIIYNYKKIIEVSMRGTPYYEFLIFVSLNVLLIIFSFAVDYSCIYWIDPSSFSNVSEDFSFERMFFEFFYLSMLSYTNFGFAEILPVSGYAKLLVILEDIISYSMTIFILADFVSLKDSIRDKMLVSQSKDKSA
jgi:hypothetical protein